MSIISLGGVDYPAPATPVQADSQATSLEPNMVPTGGTIESYVSKLLNPTVYSPGTGCTMIKVGKIVICRMQGMGGLNNFSASMTGALLINDAHAEYRPSSTTASDIGLIYNNDSNNYVAICDFHTNGNLCVTYKGAVNTRSLNIGSNYGLYGSFCWIAN